MRTPRGGKLPSSSSTSPNLTLHKPLPFTPPDMSMGDSAHAMDLSQSFSPFSLPVPRPLKTTADVACQTSISMEMFSRLEPGDVSVSALMLPSLVGFIESYTEDTKESLSFQNSLNPHRFTPVPAASASSSTTSIATAPSPVQVFPTALPPHPHPHSAYFRPPQVLSYSSHGMPIVQPIPVQPTSATSTTTGLPPPPPLQPQPEAIPHPAALYSGTRVIVNDPGEKEPKTLFKL